jgi:hypothetical protein
MMILHGRRLAERAAPVQSWMKQRHHARLPVAVAALRTRQARAGVCDAQRAGTTGAVEMLYSTLHYNADTAAGLVCVCCIGLCLCRRYSCSCSAACTMIRSKTGTPSRQHSQPPRGPPSLRTGALQPRIAMEQRFHVSSEYLASCWP